MEACQGIKERLEKQGLRIELDDRDNVSAGWKFNEWELKGVPVRLEVGPRDIENGQAMSVRRDTFEKKALTLDTLEADIVAMLDDIQSSMYQIALNFREERTKVVHNMEELTQQVNGGYAKTMWCGERACEDTIKELTQATSRNMPFDQTPIGDTCVCCGKKADKVMYFSKSY